MTAFAAPPTVAGVEDDDDELLRRFQAWFEEARTGSQEWRDAAREDYRFDAGDQWDEKQKSLLIAEDRPVVVFNRVHSIIESIRGLEIGQRQEVRAIPRETGDAGAAEVATAHMDWQREGCDADDEESDAFSDMTICGMGWTETRMDMEADPNGMTRIERFSPFEAYWDPASQKKNLVDAKFVMRVRTLSYEDAAAEFPDADRGDLNAGWADDIAIDSDGKKSDDSDYPNDQENDQENDQLDPKRNCRIVQVQWWERVPYYRVKGPNGIEEVSKEQLASLKERLGEVQAIKATRKIYKQAFVGAKVLEKGPCPCAHEFTLQCMTGVRDHAENSWYGKVRHMKDPQRYANKFFSTTMHVMSTNAKGGIVIEKSAMVNPRKFQSEWAKPNSISVVEDGTLREQRFQYKPANTYPDGLVNLMEYSISSIRDTSGVNLELLGMADRQQAGVLEAQRKKSAMTILAPFFDALSLYRRRNGRTLIYFMRQYYPAQRIARVVGVDEQQLKQIEMGMSPQAQQAAQMGDPQAQQLVQMAQSPESQKMMELAKSIPKALEADSVQYDVKVDEAPTSPNQEEMIWAAILQAPQLLQSLPPAAQMELMPIPITAKQRLLKALQPPPDPMVEEAKKIELDTKGAELQKTSGEARKVNAEAVEQEMQVAVGAQLLQQGGAKAMVEGNMRRANKQEQPRG